MSFEEAARELGISEGELEKLVASGEIASTKDGDSLLFKKEAIDNYKNQGEAEIILSDDDLNLLDDDDDEIDFGIDLSGGDDAADEDAASDLPDIAAEDDDAPIGDETVLDVESLLSDDDSEGTTPIPGSDDSGEDSLGDETLLDTDILDLGDDIRKIRSGVLLSRIVTAGEIYTEIDLVIVIVKEIEIIIGKNDLGLTLILVIVNRLFLKEETVSILRTGDLAGSDQLLEFPFGDTEFSGGLFKAHFTHFTEPRSFPRLFQTQTLHLL
jgi:excisionase family DNA binding protein